MEETIKQQINQEIKQTMSVYLFCLKLTLQEKVFLCGPQDTKNTPKEVPLLHALPVFRKIMKTHIFHQNCYC